jgi:hypothetical protein
VIYAVLLVFTVIVVWEKFSAAENAVDQEAASIAALLRYAGGKEPAAVALRQSVAAYAQTAIQDEGDGERVRKPSDHAGARCCLWRCARARPHRNSGERGYGRGVPPGRQYHGFPRVRLHLATGLVPNIIWLALFAGALLTVGFTLFFGSENLLAQIAMTGVLSTLVTLGLVVIVSIDHPFTGPVRVHPDPIANVLAEFETP